MNDITFAIKKYVGKFDLNDEDIDYKYKHSYRVEAFSRMLSKGLSLEDQFLAQIIGLYHDIGRFEQDKLYNTYTDTKKFDHGDYGYDVLINQGLITVIPVDEKFYDLIAKAVKNHNKYEIEDGLNEREILHAKIVRDADKLDIFRSEAFGLVVKKALDPEDDNFEIRKELIEDFYKEKPIVTKKYPNTTTAEKVLICLALVYDLNFQKSKDYLIKNNILDIFLKRLKYQDRYKEYFDYAKDYLEKR